MPSDYDTVGIRADERAIAGAIFSGASPLPSPGPCPLPANAMPPKNTKDSARQIIIAFAWRAMFVMIRRNRDAKMPSYFLPSP